MIQSFDKSLYNDEFFLWHKEHAHEYSVKTMDWFIDNYKPQSVIDFGCGIGSYLLSAYKKGLYIVGFDIGAEAAYKYMPEEIKPFIHSSDCTQYIKTSKFDCVISFETAEHIEPSGTTQFVLNLVSALSNTGTLLFTAAPPGQEGTGHINCQPLEYWVKQFEELGLVRDLINAEKIKSAWKELGTPYYIINNLLVFKKSEN